MTGGVWRPVPLPLVYSMWRLLAVANGQCDCSCYESTGLGIGYYCGPGQVDSRCNAPNCDKVNAGEPYCYDGGATTLGVTCGGTR